MPNDSSLPILSIESATIDNEVKDKIESTVSGSIRYAFVGSGQGGCRIAKVAYDLGYRKTICINTSIQDLSEVDMPDSQKLLLNIGAGGAGKNMLVGEEAINKYRQDIYDLMHSVFGRNVDHIIVCVGSGGGSGGGSAIPLTMIAKEYMRSLGYVSDMNKRVGVIMTLPTSAESRSARIASNSINLAERLSELANNNIISPFVVVDNDRISKLRPKLTMANYWDTINNDIIGLLDIFNRLSVRHSKHTSFDPADYASIMMSGGHVIMGVTSIVDKNIIKYDDDTFISKSMRDNLEKNLLAGSFDLKTASVAAVIVVGSEDIFSSAVGLPSAISYGIETLATMTGSALIHHGIYEDSREGLRVYTIIGGLDKPNNRYEILKSLTREAYP